jgi:pSer/pThr/pTyr-binding forkhead associated (FHA) protein
VRTVHKFGYRFVGDVLESAVSLAAGPGPQPSLVSENRRTILLEGANVIGRAPDATIVCDAPGVSRHHARILLTNGQATMEDPGSKNGTLLRGNRSCLLACRTAMRFVWVRLA